MAYGIWFTIMGAGLLFSSPHWWLQVIGGVVSAAGLLMMAGTEKVMKDGQVTLLRVGGELIRRSEK